MDNRRLKEIPEFKNVYYHELNKTESISECSIIQSRIEELEKEENEILERNDVKL